MSNTKQLTKKGIIIATQEKRIANWMTEYTNPHIDDSYVLKYAEDEKEFYILADLTETTIAFVELDFFGDDMIGELEYIKESYPDLSIVIFSPSYAQPIDLGRYVFWGAKDFISLRDLPKNIDEQIKTAISGINAISTDALYGLKRYNCLMDSKFHFSPREIEIIRLVAKEKTIKEIGHILGISADTVRNYRSMLYQKCGVNNMIGLVKIALIMKIITVNE
jgi:DNA-binding NarL/FixJ family response regulator